MAKPTLDTENGQLNLLYAIPQEKHDKYGVDGVMIGRGIFSNPWIFEKSIAENSVSFCCPVKVFYAQLPVAF